MSKVESQIETATLASQLANMQTNEQNKAEIGIDISQVQVKPTMARGRKNWRRVGLAIATSRRFSTAIEKARAKNSYRNPLTGETIEWSERPMDDKPLSEKICNKTKFFNDTENIKWMLIAIPGNNKVYYGVLEGAVPMGVVKMGKGGYFKLHWHNETEHYLITSGRGTFTIGTEERDITVDKFPVLVTIPGNVPHQVYNPHEEDLIWYYFFPEVTCTDTMRYFYPCGTHTDVYQRFPSTERSEQNLKKTK